MSDAALWSEIGNIQLKIGCHQEAIASYTKAIELDPDSGWTYCNLGHAFFLSGEYGLALPLLRKSILLMKTAKDQAAAWNKIGDAYRALKDIDNAIQAYRKADDLDMGAALSDPGPGSGSRAVEGLLTRLQPERTAPTLEEGGGSLAGRDPQAVPAALQAVQKDAAQNNETTEPPVPARKPLIVIPGPDDLGDTLPVRTEPPAEAGEKPRVAPVVGQDEILNSRPKDAAAYAPPENLEEILAKVNIYENITRVNPNNDRAWDTLGKLYKSLGRYRDAIVAYQKAIALAPDREVYYYYLGLLYSVEGLHNEAVEAFQVVLKKNPDYILAHSALAGVYHRMGQENKANHHIATALPKMNNESAYNRACFFAICGDTELALEFLRLALKNKDTTIDWIKSDPDLDPIRTDDRYHDLITGKEQEEPEKNAENFFSSNLEGVQNRLLPALNQSLAR